ncbi:MAG: DUF2232 domain-containing protein [Bdellovibrionaceae bacterium]|nr:DUF2232 domain-containing protein [Pseudobdellovibrionaceae bacterium]
MTEKKGSFSRLSVVSGIAVMMSILTVVFGTPFLRVIRNVYGSLAFWGLVILFLGGATLLKADWLSFLVGSVWLTTGISLELEKRKVSFFWNSLWSLGIGFSVCSAGLLGMLRSLGVVDMARATEYFKEAVKPLIKGQVEQEIDYAALVLQIPSMVFIVLLVSLATGYLMERRVRFWFRLMKQGYVYKFDFLKFKVSEKLIWLALASLLFNTLGSMLKDLQEIGVVASNLVNVFLVVYFFQGLAVLENLLFQMRAGIFLRTLSYFIFLGQLFLVLSIVGFLDFWFDFRGKIKIGMNRQAT